MQLNSTFNIALCKPRVHVSTQISRNLFLSSSSAIATAVLRRPDPTHSYQQCLLHDGATPTPWMPANRFSSGASTHYYRGSFSFYSLTCTYEPNRFCPTLVIYLAVPSSNLHPVISHEIKKTARRPENIKHLRL